MFDWSNLERASIMAGLLNLAHRLTEQTITVYEFHKIITNYLKKTYPIKVSMDWDEKVKSHGVLVGGTYYSDYDEDDKKCIELNFIYHPVYEDIKITKRRYKGICSVIADTLLHEIIHMRQYRRRDFKSLPNYSSSAASTKLKEEQEYLGCTDEVDAYGFNIACELLAKFKGDQKQVIKYLGRNIKHTREDGGSWKMYLKAFEHNHKHEIIKRLQKKVIRYLPRAEEGKPFKSSDWICY
jgi:hypothetical protein